MQTQTTNKARNAEATRIHRPILEGRVRDDVEAVATAIVDILFGENLLPPAKVDVSWHPRR